jgi:hypothetical protein
MISFFLTDVYDIFRSFLPVYMMSCFLSYRCVYLFFFRNPSSTWRLTDPKFAEVRQALAAHGVEITGATPNRENLHVDNQRPDEIGAFLSTYPYPVDKWIAIDDLPLDLFAKEGRQSSPGCCLTSDHFVKTCDSTGLTEELAVEAVRKLT